MMLSVDLRESSLTFDACVSCRISPEVAQRVSNYVNRSDKVIQTQAIVRGFLARKRVKEIRIQREKDRNEANGRDEKKHNTSAVFSALKVRLCACVRAYMCVFSLGEMQKMMKSFADQLVCLCACMCVCSCV